MISENSRLLIVDDMLSMRVILKKMLEELKINSIETASDGNDAWNKLSQSSTSFDLLISDWNMPNCTGIELLRKIKADSKFKNLKVIFVTSEGDAADMKEAMELGANAYLIKPLQREVLKKTLDSL